MLNFIGRVIPSVASRVLHACERDRARNDVVIGDKAVSAVRWLECDAQARFCHDGVKIASNWVPYLTPGIARVFTSCSPKEGRELVAHDRPRFFSSSLESSREGVIDPVINRHQLLGQ